MTSTQISNYTVALLNHVSLVFTNNYNILRGKFVRRDKYNSNIA